MQNALQESDNGHHAGRIAVPMNTKGQRILLWTAPPAAALFALAYLLFPVFSPPLSPTLPPEEVAAFFGRNTTGILGVVILCNLIACSLVPLFAVTAVQISRTATSSSVFTYAYIICVGIGRRRSSSPTTAGGWPPSDPNATLS